MDGISCYLHPFTQYDVKRRSIIMGASPWATNRAKLLKDRCYDAAVVVEVTFDGRDLTDKSFLIVTEGKNKHSTLTANKKKYRYIYLLIQAYI